MDESLVSKTLDEATSLLGGEAAWISDSSLHLRAFYLGVYVGMGQLGPDSDREHILFEMLHKTMFARAGDDLVGSSALGANLRAVRERLHRSLDSSRGMSSSLDDDDLKSFRELARCIEQLDEKWRFHCDLAQRALGGTKSNTVSPKEALRVLDVLDSSFREWLRVFTERPHTSEG